MSEYQDKPSIGWNECRANDCRYRTAMHFDGRDMRSLAHADGIISRVEDYTDFIRLVPASELDAAHEELAIVRERNVVLERALASEKRLRAAAAMESTSVWEDHERQFASQQAKLDAAKAEVERLTYSRLEVREG